MDVLSQIKRHEGLRLKPYYCTEGKLTIAYGRNLEDRGVSQDEADYLLANDLVFFKDRLAKELPWYLQLSEVRQAVLVNMAFNLGVDGLLKFKRMLSAAHKGNYELAAVEMLDSRWAGQVGYRAQELSEQMRTNEWQ